MSSDTESGAATGAVNHSEGEIIYLSWGGTGRAASFRTALTEAVEAGRSVVYLAVLDDSHFGDVDDELLDLAKDELGWLLDVQVDLTCRQAGHPDAPVKVLVRAGDIADEVVEVLDMLGTDDHADGRAGEPEVVIGAPVPSVGDVSVDQLLASLRSRAGVTVRIVAA